MVEAPVGASYITITDRIKTITPADFAGKPKTITDRNNFDGDN
jgi:hypothetical protein